MAGLINMAGLGRNGDTRVAHLTPGEMVIPKEVAALRPDLVAHISQQIAQMGGDPRTKFVGMGRVNPQTGIEEFASEAEVTAAYQQYLGRAPDAEGLAYYTTGNNFSADAFRAGAQSAGETYYDHNTYSAPGVLKDPGGSSAPATSTAAPSTPSQVVTPDYINSIYQSAFGRPADTAGMTHYMDQYNKGLLNYDNIDDTIIGSAKGSDMLAKADSAKYETAWTPTYDPNSGNLTYDPTKDKWMLPEQKTTQVTQAPSEPQYKPKLDSAVDFNNETIEGRINNLMASPVVRQAGERAMAMFAGRGLLNSSMAVEAANEAMISKAIEIAGPDAATYFQNRRQNVDWTNKFAQEEQGHKYDLEKTNLTYDRQADLINLQQKWQQSNVNQQQANALQQNYLTAIQQYESQYNQAVASIQGAEMSAENKTAMIQQMGILRDNNIRMITNGFSFMPQWQDEWGRIVGTLDSGLKDAPRVDISNGPNGLSRQQLKDAILYAAEDPSFMSDQQFDEFAKAAVTRGLMTQQEYDKISAEKK